MQLHMRNLKNSICGSIVGREWGVFSCHIMVQGTIIIKILMQTDDAMLLRLVWGIGTIIRGKMLLSGSWGIIAKLFYRLRLIIIVIDVIYVSRLDNVCSTMAANRRTDMNVIATYVRSRYALVIGLFCGWRALMGSVV